jgi:Cellulase (glycosyl hydrolase family 5)
MRRLSIITRGLKTFVATLKTNGGSYTGTIKIVGSQFSNGISIIKIRGGNSGFYEYTIPNQIAYNQLPVTALKLGLPNFALYAQKWRMNCMRFSINVSCWLGGTWYDTTGTGYNSDPSNDYKAGLDAQVAAANAAGMYVIIDCHWSMPGRMFATTQILQSDYDNTIPYWTDVVNRYKNNPAVIFDSFNEPFWFNNPVPGSPTDQFQSLMGTGSTPTYLQYFDATAVGGQVGYARIFPIGIGSITGTFKFGEAITISGLTGTVCQWVDTTAGAQRMFVGFGNSTNFPASYPICANGLTITGTTSGATAVVTNSSLGWRTASHQDNINAIRAAGATNPIILSGQSWAGDLSGWLANVASDAVVPAGYSGTWVPQIAASWHPYPPTGSTFSTTINAGGTGHAVNDILWMSPWLTNQAATIQILSVNGGAITGARATSAGTGYHVDEVLTTEFSLMITSVDSSTGGVTGVMVVYGGYGYTTGQQFTNNNLTVQVTAVNGVVTGATIVSTGTFSAGTANYVQFDIITFNNSNCAKFIVRSVSASGGLINLQVLQGGSGFSTLSAFITQATYVCGSTAAPTIPIMVQVTSVGTNGVITGVQLYNLYETSPATNSGTIAAIAPCFNTQADGSGSISGVPQWHTTGAGTGASFNFTTAITQNGLYNLQQTWTYPSGIVKNGYPLLATEFGEYSYNYGTVGDVSDSMLVTFLNTIGAGYTAFAIDAYGQPHMTSVEATATPLDGFGTWYQAHVISEHGSPEVGYLLNMVASSGASANLNSANNDAIWTSGQVPSAGSPDTIYFSLNPLATFCRQNLTVNLLNQSLSGWRGNVSGTPLNYTIQVNASDGNGSYPTTGWVTLVTVTGNIYSSRQHSIATAGYNWVQIVVTSTIGNAATAFKLRVYDTSTGLLDGTSWCGDTISANSMNIGSPVTTNGYTQVPSFGQYMISGGQYGYAEPGNSPIVTLSSTSAVVTSNSDFVAVANPQVSSAIAVTKGQVVLVTAGAPYATFAPSISDTLGITWIKLGDVAGPTSQGVVWYGIVSANGTTTISVHNSASSIGGFRVHVFSNAGTPRLVASGNTGAASTSTTSITQSITPASTYSYLLMWVVTNRTGNATIPATATAGCTASSSMNFAWFAANYEITPTNALTNTNPITLGYTPDGSSQSSQWFAIEVPAAPVITTNAITITTSEFNPLQENHSIPGTGTADWLATGGNGNSYLAQVLNLTANRYVVLALGSYDAVNGVSAATYSANMLSLCQQCWAANRIVVIPTIPYSTNTTYNALITQYNTAITTLIASYPQIYSGPDYYSFFSSTNFQASGQNNTLLISSTDVGGIGGNGLVPNTVGSAYCRMLAAQWFADNLYNAVYL